MKAYVITHSSTYETRAEAVGNWLKEQGADVTWVFADFDHRELKTVNRQKPDHVYLHMAPYTAEPHPVDPRVCRRSGKIPGCPESRSAVFYDPGQFLCCCSPQAEKADGCKDCI